jgi:integrase/recombinase XerD
MPAELEWFANIDNPRTRRAYRNDIEEFSRFVGIAKPEEMRSVTRSHLIAWRKQLELRNLAGSTIRRKLSAVASLFDSLCERNAVTGFPVTPVARSIAVPSACIFPLSSYQSGAPLVPSSPCMTAFFTSAPKCLIQARAVLPSGFCTRGNPL